MNKLTIIWIIIATSLVTSGIIMFVVVMTLNNWDFTKLSTRKYETNTYEINEAFSNVSVNTDTADIRFALSDDGKCRVECYEEEKAKHSVTIQKDTLVISVNSQKAWYDHIGISFGSPKITVYLPKAEYVSLEISVSTGNVTVSDITCEDDVKINVTTGNANLTNIKCKNVISSGSTGDISLKKVIATEKLSVDRSTGNVKFDGCDAGEIYIKTSTGDVRGSLLTDKVFIAEASTGNVRVPKTTTGGKCEITTSTGDINVSIH